MGTGTARYLEVLSRGASGLSNEGVLALVLMFAAAAVYTRPTPVAPTRPKAVGACTAVTAGDLQLALGISFGRGQETASGTQSTCDYTARTAQVSITIQRLAGKVDIPVEIEALKRELPGSTARIVDGMGVSAFLLEIPDAGAQLHIIRGERDYLMVSILGLGDAPVVSPAAERLARAALSRL